MPRKGPSKTTAARASGRARRAPSRAEKQERTRRALFDATVKVVGQQGYADATISKITARARVAQGTFYNYFSSQQDLFNQLLPQLGSDLLDRIREARKHHASAAEKEEAGFRTFFDYLLEVPEFYRILNEAEIFAPKGHRTHVANMAGGYLRALARARERGEIIDLDDRGLEVVAHMLLAVRHYLAMRYTYGDGGLNKLPDWVAASYMKLLREGLFTAEGKARARGGSKAPPHSEPASVAVLFNSLRIHPGTRTDHGATLLEMPVDGRHLDGSGSVHRAVVTALIEAAGALAIEPDAPQHLILVNLASSFIRPAVEGKLVAHATCSASGQVIQFASIRVAQDATDGPRIATAHATYRRR